MIISKRYKDIFKQYLYKSGSTPFTLGTIVVCIFCFIMLLISSFTQFVISHNWFTFSFSEGFNIIRKMVPYGPQIPLVVFIIYLLGKRYSYAVFGLYLLIGLFVWPILVFGGGMEYFKNYLCGYFLGYFLAVFTTGSMISYSQTVLARVIAAFLGVFSIHAVGMTYCVLLAIFGKLEFSMIFPIVKAITFAKIQYDLLFTILLLLAGPYIKSVFWVCMKPKINKKKL